MSDRKLLQASSSNDLAWLEKVSDVSDFWSYVGGAYRKTEALPVSDLALSVSDQIREGSTASPTLAHCRRL